MIKKMNGLKITQEKYKKFRNTTVVGIPNFYVYNTILVKYLKQ